MPPNRSLRLVWVYPDLLSTYGDRGNVLVLERRAKLRGIPVEIINVNSDQPVTRDGDIYLMGGGEDLPQTLAAKRLLADGGLHAAVQNGAVIFAVCAGYQMLGTEFGGADGMPVQGLGLLDMRSGRGERRAVGEIVADVDPALNVGQLTGFENHQGVTRLGPNARPLARATLGTGNGDGTEGAYAGQVLGTYLHGPALVRNPNLADLLLYWAAGPLPPLSSRSEELVSRLRGERLAAVTQLSPGGTTPRTPRCRAGPARWQKPPLLVDQCLGIVCQDLGEERGRPGDPDPGDHVLRPDVPAGSALAADRYRAQGDHRSEQVGKRCRVRQREVVRPARQREPRRLAGQPQGNGDAARDRGRRHREGLIAPLRFVFASCDLNHKFPRHNQNSNPTGVPTGANRTHPIRLNCHARDAERGGHYPRLRCRRHRRRLRGHQGDQGRPA